MKVLNPIPASVPPPSGHLVKEPQTHAGRTILNPWLWTGLVTYCVAPSPSLRSWWPISKLTTLLYELHGKKDKNNQPTPYHVPQFQRTRKKNKQQEFRLSLEQLSNKWTICQLESRHIKDIHLTLVTSSCALHPQLRGDWGGEGGVEHSFLWYVEPWAQKG